MKYCTYVALIGMRSWWWEFSWVLAAGYTICLQLNSLHSVCYSKPGCFLLSNGRNSSSSADGCPFLQCPEEVQFRLSHFVPANNCSSSSPLFPLAVAAVWCHLEFALSSFTLLILSDGMFSPGHTHTSPTGIWGFNAPLISEMHNLFGVACQYKYASFPNKPWGKCIHLSRKKDYCEW